MTKTGYLLLALATGALLLPSGSANADNAWKQSTTLWHQMDKCTRAALKQYPDHTPDAIAKREHVRRLCLRSSNLPGDDDASSQPAATADRH